MKEIFLKNVAKNWSDLLEGGQLLQFSRGQVLFYEGHYPYGLFVVQKGKVRFTKDGRLCRENHVWKAPEGRVVGAEAFFEEMPYCCTCTSQDCEAIFISKTQLLPYLNKLEGGDSC